jgi:Zn ribbon nucleic-acid-binding protein
MKNNRLSKYLAMAVIAIAVVGFILTPASAQAQVRGAQKLISLKTTEDLSHLEPGDMIVMSCHKCKDTYVSVVDTEAKGSLEKTKNVAVHLCPTCSTEIKLKGWGKSAKEVLVHKCNMCGSEKVNCCILKKNTVETTPGMEKK